MNHYFALRDFEYHLYHIECGIFYVFELSRHIFECFVLSSRSYSSLFDPLTRIGSLESHVWLKDPRHLRRIQ